MAKKRKNIPRKNRYSWTLHLLSKNYGHGEGKRFKDINELRATAKDLYNGIYVIGGKSITLSNIKAELGDSKRKKGRAKKEGGIPEHLARFVETLKPIMPYWYLSPTAYTMEGDNAISILSSIAVSRNNVIFKSPLILGKKTLRGGNYYNYDETFKGYVDFMNKKLTERLSGQDDGYVKFLWQDMKQNKKGDWECEFISCKQDGTKVDYGYNAKTPDDSDYTPIEPIETKPIEEPKSTESSKEIPQVTDTDKEKKAVEVQIEKEKLKREQLKTLYEREDNIMKKIELYSKLGKDEKVAEQLSELENIESKIKLLI